jgi:low affinity Fe/Cu permease
MLVLVAVLAVITVTIFLLYSAAFEQQKLRLSDIVHAEASLIRAIARFDEKRNDAVGENAVQETLEQVLAALERTDGTSATGEFVLGKVVDGHIEYLYERRGMNGIAEQRYPMGGPKPKPCSAHSVAKQGS